MKEGEGNGCWLLLWTDAAQCDDVQHDALMLSWNKKNVFIFSVSR